MNIQAEFQIFLDKKGLVLNGVQRRTAILFLESHNFSPIWLRARCTGVTTLFKALEEFYKYHEVNLEPDDKPFTFYSGGK